MEYGYKITDTTGNKCFFIGGCTYCSMSTGGQHEQHCPRSKEEGVIESFTTEVVRKWVGKWIEVTVPALDMDGNAIDGT